MSRRQIPERDERRPKRGAWLLDGTSLTRGFAEIFAALGDLVAKRPGPKLSAMPARFEEMPNPCGEPDRGNRWPEPKFAGFLPLFMVLFFVAAAALLATFLFPAALREAGLVRARFQVPSLSPGVTVWVDKETGFYFCPESQLYRRTPGEAMSQMQAFTMGYRPIAGVYCGATAAPKLKPVAQR